MSNETKLEEGTAEGNSSAAQEEVMALCLAVSAAKRSDQGMEGTAMYL